MTTETQGKDLVLRLVRHRLEPDWLRDLRVKAFDAYEALPNPTYEKSDLGKRQTGPFAPGAAPKCPDSFAIAHHFHQAKPNRIVFANGTIVKHNLRADLAKEGVLFTDLSLAVRMFPNLVQPYLGQLVPINENKWIALQSAIWNAGAFLYVPKGVHISLPLQLWWNRTQGGGQLHPRLLVVAEEQSDVTLLTGEVSQVQEAAFSVLVVEVFAKQGARVRIASMQEQDEKMTEVSCFRADVARDAQVEWLFADVGAGYSIADIHGVLKKEGGTAHLNAIALGSGCQHLDLTLGAHHIARSTTSRMRAHAILTDQARTIFRAVSQIEKGAVGTNSTQEERLLLLAKTAQAHPIPMLLIAEEDVRCDHAVSVGNLPPDQLFYLMARGLPEAEAKRLMLRSFLSPLVQAMPLPGLAPAFDTWVERKITR